MKKERIELLLSVVLLLCVFCMSTKKVTAQTEGSIIESSYYRNALTDKISADHAFIMRNGESTKIEKVSGVVNSERIITGIDSVKESAALIRNVGYYQGHPVNVKVTVKMLQPSGADMLITKNEFLRLKIWANGTSEITYEFLDDKMQPIQLKTTFNEMGLNKWKDIRIPQAATAIEHIFAAPDSTIQYSEDEQGTLTLKGQGNADNWSDDACKLAITTKAISKFQFIVKNNDSRTSIAGISELQYLSNFFPAVEFPYAYPQPVATQNIENNEVITCFQQTVPYLDPKNFRSSLSYKIENPKQNQFQIKGLKVKDFYGNDRTSWFDQKIDEQGNLFIQAKASTLKNRAFYDNSYQFTLYHTFIGGADRPVDPDAIIDDCFLLQPVLYEDVGDGERLIGNLAATIYYYNEVKINFVDENNQPLLNPGTIKGRITDSVDLSSFYPTINGYYPIPAEKNRILVMPGAQEVFHHYKKGVPLLFTLKDRQQKIVIPRFSKTVNLSYDFSHDRQQKIQVVAQHGEKKQVLKKYDLGNIQTEDTVAFNLPEDWLNKEVNLYLENEEGEKSAAETRVFVPESGPRLQLPAVLSFGTHSIPAFNQYLFAESQPIKVEDNSRLEQSKWTVKVKIETPLKNNQQQELRDALVFAEKTGDVLLSEQEQPVWEGSGSATLAKNRLKLLLRPTDHVGKYSGSLVWTLEDAPQ
ncbi:hypothetical protein [Enterococcus sp.]|uniref:hypothetical protein n=1 Tax=Enterococcus sp. TaxID=35783 RepID=UPI0025C6B5B6|nr:hypothetical protein [Enterococcus sp.]